MIEPELGRKVAQLLYNGLNDLKQGTLNQLQSARRASLENYRMAETIVTVGRGTSARGGHNWHLKTGKLLSLITFLLVLLSAVYWQALHQSDENEEIDIMLLVDDLPINAYLDNEFDAWLDRS